MITNVKLKIGIEPIDKDVIIPSYAHPNDAGMDIRANEDIFINPQETKIIKTGFKLLIPEGYEVQIRPRSGLSLNTPLRIPNAPGTIDCGYRNEIGIIINNSSINGSKVYETSEKGNKPGIYHIKKGDRIAQMIVTKYETIEFELMDYRRKS